jgi:hypothetical protein
MKNNVFIQQLKKNNMKPVKLFNCNLQNYEIPEVILKNKDILLFPQRLKRVWIICSDDR